ncbi:MAG: hypothetical protein OXQ28_11915 [Acidobacteriota bacterium]|nr:hypothetical protein [Acidobacteriota bacterium]
MQRGDKALVRDVFDLIKAAEYDPRALAAAVNCHSDYETEVRALMLENADAALEREAPVQLVGVRYGFDVLPGAGSSRAPARKKMGVGSAELYWSIRVVVMTMSSNAMYSSLAGAHVVSPPPKNVET